MSQEAIDLNEFKRALSLSAKSHAMRPALDRLMSQPIENIVTIEVETNWVVASGTFEVRVQLCPADGYREFMAEFRRNPTPTLSPVESGAFFKSTDHVY